MSAPETTSKGRPSLLSETAPGAADNSSRILASLEGRVAAQQASRPFRFKKQFIAAALAVVGVGAIGAWQWQRSQDRAYPVTAVVGGNVASPATGGASAATGNASVVAQQRQDAASTPQAAVIVADETPASSPSVAGDDPLSRALADGAASATGKTASGAVIAGAPGAASGAAKSAAGRAVEGRTQRDGAKHHRSEKLAAARAGRQAKAADDSDADLLSALISRTKPYDSHAAWKAKAAPGKEHVLSLAARVKECEKSNFFEAQICRWHVCSDHWGKDPACPSANNSQETR